MTVTVNLATVAGILAKETSLSHGQALNVVAKACGLADVGALKASAKASATQSVDNAPADSKLYVSVRFDIRNGNFQDTHRAVLIQSDGETLDELKLRAWEYALFFYDDLGSCAESQGLQPEQHDEFLLNCISQYGEVNCFSNADGELMIINVDIQESDKAHFDAMQIVNRI